MRYLIFIFLPFCLGGTATGGVNIDVVYPTADQQIPSVESTFIFGNVTRGAELDINGFPVEVHKYGGWLAFLPVEKGNFEFTLTAVLENDTARAILPIQVGPAELIDLLRRPVIPKSPYPDSNVMYSTGDELEFSFRAPPGGTGWFEIGNSGPVRMFYNPDTNQSRLASVFGEITKPQEIYNEFISYSGSYRLTAADTGIHSIEYWYVTPGFLQTRKMQTAEIVKVIDEYPPVVGKLTGTSHIIRTGIGKGYKLLYLPPGIKTVVKGAEKGYYRINLGENISGYINTDSLEILPTGTAGPTGDVAFITVNESDDNVEIACQVGEKLPYEIMESPASGKIDIDIFGATGDVDWIRYNNEGDFIRIVKWSQPSNDIFRISVEFENKFCGGYLAYYDSTRFIIKIKKNPESRRWPFKPLRGVKIAVDPGHSHDSGARGPTRLNEKDANLWIAHELRRLLLRNGAEVIITRYGHEHIPLYDRPKIASRWGADILISVHNNALPDGVNPFENNGVSVYYYHPHSKKLAETIHSRLVKRSGLDDHGLYYGNLVMTRPTEFQAVLVECAFMMIPEQEAMLRTDKYQRKCAGAIVDGIKDFLKTFRR